MTDASGPPDDVGALRDKLDAALRELAEARACERLNRAADDVLEQAMRDRLPLERTLEHMLPLLLEHTGASATRLKTYDEDLVMRDFEHPPGAVPSQPASIMFPLDVAGESFGEALLWLPEEPDEHARAVAAQRLEVWCEELDNHLAAIARARKKHDVTTRLSQALRHPVLETGIQEAIAVLGEAMSFDDMILAYRHEEDRHGETLAFRVVNDSAPANSQDEAWMAKQALAFIQDGSEAPLSRFHVGCHQEQVLINGVRDSRVIGRLVVGSTDGEFNTFDRDLLQRFADYLRQRIVDFNREYKRLALCFPPDTVRRLLLEEDYRERFLAARERSVAVMYCDISGFTRLSEQVLREPARIGALIDAWSAEAVECIWAEGGVFDKMVGDCIIGLWGPPFFEEDATALCERALRTAQAIRRFTESLASSDAFPELAEADVPLTVSTGLHHCPLFVGLFGPNEGYTGFSAGMNNAARLQGLAAPGEILCMEPFVEALGDHGEFSAIREAAVKNVAAPLRYRAAP